MAVTTMKIPANGATRLSEQTWIEAEAFRRFMGESSIRKAIEKLVAEGTNKHLGNKEFTKVLQEVRSEGVENA